MNNLNGANLANSNFTGAEGITNEELVAQASGTGYAFIGVDGTVVQKGDALSAEFTVEASEGNMDLCANWENLDPIPEGSFVIDYGDGTIEVIKWDNNDNSYTHTYAEAGTYTVKIYGTPYVFISLLVTEVLSLNTSLQALYLYSCPDLTTPPTLTGLIALETLSLNMCNRLTTPPTLTGLTALQTLDLSGCALTTPPTLTGLIALETLYLNGCALVIAGVDSILTDLTPTDFTELVEISLQQTPAAVPTPATKAAFILNHPATVLTTD